MNHRSLATPAATMLARRRPFALAFLLAAALPAVAPARAAADDDRVVNRVVVGPRAGNGALFVSAKRGFLGVDLVELTPELRRHFGAGEESGVLVAHVEAGSPAANAGVRVGDVLVAIEGKPVKSSWSLRELVAPRKEGDTLALEIVRAGARQQLQATLVERPGRVLELGKLMEGRLLGDGDGDGDETVIVMPSARDWEEIGKDWARFGEEMGHWGEQLGQELAGAFANPEVRSRIEREFGERERLQRKIEMLELRLRDLERRLEEQNR